MGCADDSKAVQSSSTPHYFIEELRVIRFYYFIHDLSNLVQKYFFNHSINKKIIIFEMKLNLINKFSPRLRVFCRMQ